MFNLKRVLQQYLH